MVPKQTTIANLIPNIHHNTKSRSKSYSKPVGSDFYNANLIDQWVPSRKKKLSRPSDYITNRVPLEDIPEILGISYDS